MNVDLTSIKKSIILIGIFVTLMGLSLHLSGLGTTRSGFPANALAREVTVEHIEVPNSTGFEFGIELLGPEQIQGNGTSAYLLDSSQYTDYLSGTPLNETDALISLVNGGRGSFETTLIVDLDIYLVLTNDNNATIPWSYYYYLLPSTFYPTFTIVFIGAFSTIFGLAWFYNGWKRWFLACVGIQSLFFLVRVFTLSTYSLNLPEIFWNLIHTEMYNDYQYFYLSWIPRLWEGAWAYSSDLAVYLYPPLWIYTVGLFGSTPSWLPGLILVTFNAATGFLVYKIAFRITENDTRSKIVMMFSMLNPLTLFYGSFLWLNPSPYVFFTILSFYLALIEKDEFSIASIAIATLYKQLAVVFFPIIVTLLIKRKTHFQMKDKLVSFLRHTTIYTGIIGLVSLPFLIVSPEEYLNQMILWNTGNYDRLTTFIPGSWMTVHANTFFLWLGFPSWFIDTVAFLTINYVFLILCGILVYGGFAFLTPHAADSNEGNQIRSIFMKAILWSFVAVMSVQLFYPRGSYKFYLLALAPFAALLFDYKDLGLSMKSGFTFQKHHVFMISMSWVVFLCFRFVYFWLLGAWVLFFLIKSGESSRILRSITGFFNGAKHDITALEEIYSE